MDFSFIPRYTIHKRDHHYYQLMKMNEIKVDLTQNGKQMIANFLYKACGLEGIYTLDDREHRAVEYIR